MVSASSVTPFVAVLMGGRSAERDVSLDSGKTVVRELAATHRVEPIEILADGLWNLDSSTFSPVDALNRLLERRVDVVFNALHGPFGEDGTMQGLFRQVGLPLTGPDVIPAAVSMDKRLTKLALEAVGLSTPASFALRARERPTSAAAWAALGAERGAVVPFPWIIKPNRLGSSVGVDIVETAEQLAERAPAIAAACKDDELLVENRVRGRELSCPVLELDDQVLILPPIELRPRESTFFDYHAKYTAGATEEICPAPLTESERQLVEEAARTAHETLRCEPLSRTDLFLCPDGQLVVLEVNSLPGLTETSLVPLAAKRVGLELSRLFCGLVDHATRRARSRGDGIVGTSISGEPLTAPPRRSDLAGASSGACD